MDQPPKHLQAARSLYSAYLKKNKMFFTKERMSLLGIIFEQDGHFSADELMFQIQKAGHKLSRATVYRNLSQMVAAGILAESDFGHGHTHYEVMVGSKPHVHFICEDTGEVREVYSPRLEALLTGLARKEGIRIQRYKIQIFGQAGAPR